MRPHTGGIDRHHPLRIISVATALQTAQRPLPGPITRPCPMPAIHGLPRPVRPRQIPPRRARPGPPQNPVHHPPVRDPRTSLTARALHRKERFQPSPLLIGQIMTIMHATITPEPDPDLCQTRPRAIPRSTPRQIGDARLGVSGGSRVPTSLPAPLKGPAAHDGCQKSQHWRRWVVPSTTARSRQINCVGTSGGHSSTRSTAANRLD